MTLTTTLRCVAAAAMAVLLTAVLVAMLSGALQPAVAATADDGAPWVDSRASSLQAPQ
jgi:hypothetical protein